MANTKETLLFAAAAGAICGMRSLNLPAFLSRRLAGRRKIYGTFSPLLAHPLVAMALPAAAAGEVVVDKTPVVPPRTDIPALFGRIGMAKVCAIVIAEQRREDIVLPATVAATTALAGTYAAYYIRRFIGEKLRVPDLITAFAEDAIVVTSSSALTDAALGE
jgi:uncharacterized membrane protein